MFIEAIRASVWILSSNGNNIFITDYGFKNESRCLGYFDCFAVLVFELNPNFCLGVFMVHAAVPCSNPFSLGEIDLD